MIVITSRITLAIPVVDDDIVCIDALPVPATFQRYGGGGQQDQVNGARSLHKIYCGFAEINLRIRAAVDS